MAKWILVKGSYKREGEFRPMFVNLDQVARFETTEEHRTVAVYPPNSWVYIDASIADLHDAITMPGLLHDMVSPVPEQMSLLDIL